MLDPQVLKQFRCSGCGECCRWSGAVLLEESDHPRLAARLGLSEQEFIDLHTISTSIIEISNHCLMISHSNIKRH